MSTRKRIVVAGAGSASGRAVVSALEGAGCEVVALTRDVVDLSDAHAVHSLALSLTSADGTDGTDSADGSGRVDGLVHLVGGWRGGGGIAGQSDEDWEFLSSRVIDTLRHTSRAFYPALLASAGRLVIVSTTGLDKPTLGNANYLAAKGAAEAWTRAVGQGLAKVGGGIDILRVMALFTDEDRAAGEPDKDWSRWTHVDDLGRQVAAVFTPTR